MADRSSAAPDLVSLLCARASDDPKKLAFRFLTDGEGRETTLTYGQLDRRSRAVAVSLQPHVAPGDRVLLLYPAGLDYITAFFGCLYAGAIAVPAYPPASARALERVLGIADDAGPAIGLAPASVQRRAARLGAESSQRWPHCLEPAAAPDVAGGWQPPPIDGATIALLQYTSGSTSSPKGVIVSHANLLHNQQLIRRAFGHSEHSSIVGWLPLYHDMGLIGNVLQSVFLGVPCTLMSPAHFIQRPVRWLRAISRYQGTSSGGPNFAYELCIRKIPPPQREALDLSSWRVAFNGAEPVRPETLSRFAEAFRVSGLRPDALYPCYGLAESTLLVAGRGSRQGPVVRSYDRVSLKGGRARPTSPSGRASALVGYDPGLADQRLLIVDPETSEPCSPGQIGEIWSAGPSVTHGYWRRPEETAATFGGRLASCGDDRFLRTGDLGFIDNGQLFITGRLKDLIIIRGRNHHPEDIERTVEHADPALRPGGCAAFAVERDREERLVVAQEVERSALPIDTEALARKIRRAIAELHDVHAYAVLLTRPGKIPKTSSGKIRRRACRDRFLAGSLDLLGHSTMQDEASGAPGASLTLETLLSAEGDERRALLQAYLQDLVAQVGALPAGRVDADRPLGEWGLDSVMAIQLQHTLEHELGLRVPMVSFLLGRSVSDLAGEMLADLPALPSDAGSDRSGTDASEFPASHGQRALWFLCQLDRDSPVYNVARAVGITGPLDLSALERAVRLLAVRHPSLSAVFDAPDGEARMRLGSTGDLSLRLENAAGWTRQQLQARLDLEAARPFDLERGPLCRFCLFRRSPREHVLLLSAHHVVVDLWSMAVLLRDFERLYSAEVRGRPLAHPPTWSYPEYVRWQGEMLSGRQGRDHWAYWSRQLADRPPGLSLPGSSSRPPVRSYGGAVHRFTLDEDVTHQLRALATSSGATLFSVLLAAFQVLLFRYTHQEDFLIGTPAAGRTRAAWREVVGYFVNPLVLRARPSGRMRFVDFLDQTRRTLLEALAHQDYPFSLLVERLQPERDPSRSPLFDVAFAWQAPPRVGDGDLTDIALEVAGTRARLGELSLEPIPVEPGAAALDLTVTMGDTSSGLAGSCQFSTDLFEARTMARLVGHFQTLVRGIGVEPEREISRLPLMSGAERQRVVVEWNATGRTRPRPRAIHELFQDQVARTPDRTAATFESSQLTYRELNSRANRLAHRLRRSGVGPETRVGLCVERSLDMVVGLLGILKAGGAYVPLDPDYPEPRLAYMLADAGISLLVTHSSLVSRLPTPGTLLCLDRDGPEIDRESEQDRDWAGQASTTAYVIYTSGSTGQPNGVAVPHGAVVNLLAAMGERPGVESHDVLLSVTTLSFDIAALEIFLPLISGARLVVASRRTAADGKRLASLLTTSGATVMQATPATWHLLLEAGWAGKPDLKILCGGEALPPGLARDLLPRGASLWNLYGPTETTIWSTVARVDAAASITLGRPIANTQILVLDRELQPVPVGVVGEVYIGGGGLARGYLSRPAMTAARFMPNPCAEEAGSRLYRTGDLGRLRGDGSLEYGGRVDSQVKIRGFRVESGEVETQLARHDSVRNTVVVPVGDAAGHQQLVAYVVPAGGAATDTAVAGSLDTPQGSFASRLRGYLQETLPVYMVPAHFVLLDSLPLMPNGKVDRRSLPRPAAAAARSTTAFAPARDELERTVAAIWQDVLQVERVGIHDNFFDLGGHSLLLARLASRLESAMAREIEILDLFRNPTVASLARFLAGSSGGVPASSPADHRADVRLALQQRRRRLRDVRRQERRPAGE